jgi:predicted RNase H-like HicB family nuclease
MTIETEREADGRWIAEVSKLPGVIAYGMTEVEARARVIVLAWQVLVDRVVAGEAVRLPTARSRQ